MSFTNDDLITALRDCFDPTLKCNIVDLGEVVSAELAEDKEAPGAGIAGVPIRYRARIALTLATREEAVDAQLIATIKNRLAGLETISGSEVELVSEPQWTPDRITPEGRKLLGLDRIPRGPELVQIKLP